MRWCDGHELANSIQEKGNLFLSKFTHKKKLTNKWMSSSTFAGWMNARQNLTVNLMMRKSVWIEEKKLMIICSPT